MTDDLHVYPHHSRLHPSRGYDTRQVYMHETYSASLARSATSTSFVHDLKSLRNTNPRTEFHVYSAMKLCVFTCTLSPFPTVRRLMILAARIATGDIRTHAYILDNYPALRGRSRPSTPHAGCCNSATSNGVVFLNARLPGRRPGACQRLSLWVFLDRPYPSLATVLESEQGARCGRGGRQWVRLASRVEVRIKRVW